MISYWKYLNTKNKTHFFHDHSSYTENLRVFDKLEGHKGCVNTIDWDKTGTRILSGGDDTTLRIHQYMCDGNKPWVENDIFQLHLPRSRNILCAKFMPIYNNQIICASKCGSIFLIDVNSTPSIDTFYKHTGPVLNVATIENDPYSFISVSNDKTMCLFDVRELDRQPVIKMQFPCALSALAIHPINTNKIATGGSDSFIRIFDKRFLSGNNMDVDNTLKSLVEACCPLEFPFDNINTNRYSLQNYGKRHVNSISYEPKTGHHLLVNYMYDSIYLFDTRQQESQKQMQVETDDSSTSIFRIHYNWDNTGPPRDGVDIERNQILCPPSIQSFLNELHQKELNCHIKSKSSQNTIESQLASIKRYKQLRSYMGHQNCRTMIKDTRFWGSKYVLSGSECGHILIWEKNEKYPIAAIPTDQHVTNRIEPHPFLPIIATCGIDYNVKIVGSDLQQLVSSDDKKNYLKKVLFQNDTRTEKAKKSQSISMMDLLRIMRAQRMIQRINDGILESNQ